MARHRRQRTGLKRPASAFAPGAGRDGKMISWEQLDSTNNPVGLTTAFPTLAFATGANQTRFTTLMPPNVTRGAVTLERIRGGISVFPGVVELAADFLNWPLMLTIQLVPLADGAILDAAVLSAKNSADMESNRIIWQRSYYPEGGGTITAPGALERHSCPNNGDVDVKSRRRFDRAEWALLLTCDNDSSVSTATVISINLRGLFRAADGL